MSTVEAIQIELIGKGYFLYIGTPESPPQHITLEDLFYSDKVIRQVPRPNPLGPLFRYTRNSQLLWWVLKETLPPRIRITVQEAAILKESTVREMRKHPGYDRDTDTIPFHPDGGELTTEDFLDQEELE